MRLTSPFNLPAPGRRQTLYVVFDLAEPCVFSKQSLDPLYCNSCDASWRLATNDDEHPLSRSYGVILPSSFSTAHPSALEYSSHPPVSVCGTGCLYHNLEVFLGGLITVTISSAEALLYYQVRLIVRICLHNQYLHPLTFYSVRTRTFHYLVTPSKYKQVSEY